MRHFLFSFSVSFLIDQASKYGVVYGLALRDKEVIEVLPPILTFHMGWNRGINFGLLGDGADWMVLVALAIVISTGLVLWGRRHFNSGREWVMAGLIVGGAMGNALDRVIFGAVADFLNVSCCGINNPYTFNVADIFIFAGALGLVFFHTDTEKVK